MYLLQSQLLLPSKFYLYMSMEEMLEKNMVDQAQLFFDVRNNQLDTQNMEKNFDSLLVLRPTTRTLKVVLYLYFLVICICQNPDFISNLL